MGQVLGDPASDWLQAAFNVLGHAKVANNQTGNLGSLDQVALNGGDIVFRAANSLRATVVAELEISDEQIHDAVKQIHRFIGDKQVSVLDQRQVNFQHFQPFKDRKQVDRWFATNEVDVDSTLPFPEFNELSEQRRCEFGPDPRLDNSLPRLTKLATHVAA